MRMFFERKVLPFILIFQMIIPQNLVFASINNDAEKEIPLEEMVEENLPEEANESIEELEEIEEVVEDEDIEKEEKVKGGEVEKNTLNSAEDKKQGLSPRVAREEATMSTADIYKDLGNKWNPTKAEWESYIKRLEESGAIPKRISIGNLVKYNNSSKDTWEKITPSKDLNEAIETGKEVSIMIPDVGTGSTYLRKEIFKDILDNPNSNITVVLPHNFHASYNNGGYNGYFNNMHGLQNVIIPPYSNNHIIQNSYFYGCTGLKDYKVPDYVSIIMPHAFNGTNIEEITIKNVRNQPITLNSYAFYNCPELRKVNVDSISRIIINPFIINHCPKLEEVNLAGQSIEFSGRPTGTSNMSNKIKLSFENLKSLQEQAFKDIDNITEVKFGDNLETIGTSAFENCQGLERVELGNSDVALGSSVFKDCKNLSEVFNSKSIKSIGAYGFKNCEKIETIDLPKLEQVNVETFMGAKSLKDVGFGDKLKSVNRKAFYNCSDLEYLRMKDNSILYYDSAFEGCKNLKGIDLGEGEFGPIKIDQEKLNQNVFKNCESIEEVEFTDKVRELGTSSFEGCSSLENIYLNKIIEVKDSTFKGCNKLNRNLIIPENLANIGANGFSDVGVERYLSLRKGINSGWHKDAFKNKIDKKADYIGYPYTKNYIAGKEGIRWAGTFIEPSDYNVKVNEAGKGRIILNNRLEENLKKVTLKVTGNILDEEIEEVVSIEKFKNNQYAYELKNIDFNKLDIDSKLKINFEIELSSGEKLDSYSIDIKVIPEYSGNWESVKPNLPASWFRYEEITMENGDKALEIVDFVPPVDFIKSMESNSKTLVKFPKEKEYILTNEGVESTKKVKIIGIGDNTGQTGLKMFKNTEVELGDNIEYIGSGAFKNAKGIIKFTMDNSVKSIGNNAFENCESLKEIRLSSNLKAIPESMLKNCRKLEKIKIPEKVEGIGSQAFENCKQLKEIDILLEEQSITSRLRGMIGSKINFSENIKVIGDGAFRNCDSLSGKLVLKTSIDEIGKEAFLGCIGLREVDVEKIDDKIISNIGEKAFESSNGLKKVTLSNIGRIGKGAFSYCNELEELNLNKKVITIGEESFSKNPKLKNITIGKDVETIEKRAFAESEMINILTFVDDDENKSNLKKIDSEAFKDAKILMELDLPESLEVIGDRAFKECGEIQTIKLNKGLKEIGEEAFSNAGCVTGDVILSENVEKIGARAFPQKAKDMNIIVLRRYQALDGWDENALSGVNNDSTKVVSFETNRKNYGSGIEKKWLEDFKNGTSNDVKMFNFLEPEKDFIIEVKENGKASIKLVNNIPSEFFREINWEITSENKKLILDENASGSISKEDFDKLEIPIKLEYTELGKIKNNNAGDKITLIFKNDMDRSVIQAQKVDEYKFDIPVRKLYGEVEPMDGVIPASWFHYEKIGDGEVEIVNFLPDPEYIKGAPSKGRLELELPSKVTINGVENKIVGLRDSENPEKGYFNQLDKLNVELKVKENFRYIGKDVFKNCLGIKKLNLEEAIDLKQIRDGAFEGNIFLEEIKFGNGIESIGNNAFKGCQNIRSLEFKEGLKTIGQNAFHGCKQVEVLKLPSTITSLGDRAFQECMNLKELDMSRIEGLKEIPNYCFISCTNLEKVTFGENLEEIKTGAFQNCKNIKSLDIPDKVTKIGTAGFYGANKLKDLKLSKNLIEVGVNAFRAHNIENDVEIPESLTTIGQYSFLSDSKNKQHYILLRHVDNLGFEDWHENSFSNQGAKDPLRILRTYEHLQNQLSKIYGKKENFITVDEDEIRVDKDGKVELLLNNHIPDYIESFEWSIDNGKNEEILLKDSIDTDKLKGKINDNFLKEGKININTEVDYNKIPLKTELTVSVQTKVNGRPDNYDIVVNLITENDDEFKSGKEMPTGFFKYNYIDDEKAEIIGFTPSKAFVKFMNENTKNFEFKFPNKVECNDGKERDIVGIGNMNSNMPFTSFRMNNFNLVFGENMRYIEDEIFKGMNFKSIKAPGLERIGDRTFENCRALERIEINSIKEIGENAFDKGVDNPSINLEVILGDKLESISEQAFYRSGIKGKLIIPASTKEIGAEAFKDCKDLTGLTILENESDNVELTIGDYAFSKCEYIEGNLNIPDRIVRIGIRAFEENKGITSLKVGEGIKEIENYSFENCSELRSISIGDKVETIGINAFNGATNLTSLELGKSIVNIGNSAFNGATNYGGALIFSDSLRTIGENAFYNMKNVEKIILNDGLNKIGAYAFAYSSPNSSIVIPESVTIIERYAFYNASESPDIIVMSKKSKSSSEYVDYAFTDSSHSNKIVRRYKDTILAGVYGKDERFITFDKENIKVNKDGKIDIELKNHIPDHLESFEWSIDNGKNEEILLKDSIGTDRLKGEVDKNLLEEGKININTEVDYNKIPLKTELTVSVQTKVNDRPDNYDIVINLITENDDEFKSGKEMPTGFFKYNYIDDEKAEIIGFTPSKAFVKFMNENTTNFDFKFPDKVECNDGNERDIVGIGKMNSKMPFTNYKMNNFSLVFGENMRYIEDEIFKGMNFKSIKAPGLERIGDRTFEKCINLERIEINSIKEIGENAFDKGVDNPSINLEVILGDKLESISKQAFYRSGIKGKLTIPASTKEIGAEAFKDCKDLIGLTILENESDNVELTIGDSAFSKCEGIEGNLNIPDRVVKIGIRAFEENKKINSLKLGDGIKEIEDYSFNNCSELQSIVIGNKVENIGISGFNGATNLTSLELGKSIANIGNSAFNGAINYGGDLIFPDSLRTIETSAFNNMKNVEKIILNDGLNEIEDNAFYNCVPEFKIVIPESVTKIGKNVFYNEAEDEPEFLLLRNILSSGYDSQAFGYNTKLVRTYKDAKLPALNARKERFITADESRVVVGKDGIAKVDLKNHLGKEHLKEGEKEEGNLESFKWKVTNEKNKGLLKDNKDISGEIKDNLDKDILELDFTLDYNKIPKSATLKIDLETIVENKQDNYEVEINVGTNNESDWFEGEEIPESFFKYKIIDDTKAEIIGFTPDDDFLEFITSKENNKEFNFKLPKTTTDDKGITRNIVRIGKIEDSMDFKDLKNANIIFQENIKEINSNAFKESNIKGIEFIGSGVEKIGQSSFENCSELETVKIKGVKYIENNAFKNNSKLKDLELGKDVIKIGDSAFEDCSYIYGEIILTDSAKQIGHNAFKNCSQIYSLELANINYLGESAFENCTSINNALVIPGSLKNILKNTFKNCQGVPSIKIEPGVEIIGESAFAECNNLEKLDTGNVITIGDSSFKNLISLNELKLSKQLNTIGMSAFQGAKNLRGDLVFTEKIKNIKKWAFKDCEGIEGIRLNENIDEIEEEAFQGATGLRGNIVIPNNLRTIGKDAFPGHVKGLHFNILRRYNNFNNWHANAFGGKSGSPASLRLFNSQMTNADKFIYVTKNPFIGLSDKTDVKIDLNGKGNILLVDNLRDPLLKRIEWKVQSGLLASGEVQEGRVMPSEIKEDGLIEIEISFDLKKALESGGTIDLTLTTVLEEVDGNQSLKEYKDVSLIKDIGVRSYLSTIKPEIETLLEEIQEKLDSDDRPVPMTRDYKNSIITRLNSISDRVTILEGLGVAEIVNDYKNRMDKIEERFETNQELEEKIEGLRIKENLGMEDISEIMSELTKLKKEEKINEKDEDKFKIYILENINLLIGDKQSNLDTEIEELEDEIVIEKEQLERLQESLKEIEELFNLIGTSKGEYNISYNIPREYLVKKSDQEKRIKALDTTEYDKIQKMINGLSMESDMEDIDKIIDSVKNDEIFTDDQEKDLIDKLGKKLKIIIEAGQKNLKNDVNQAPGEKTIDDRLNMTKNVNKLDLFIGKYKDVTGKENYSGEQKELKDKIKKVITKEYLELKLRIENITVNTEIYEVNSIEEDIDSFEFYDKEKLELKNILKLRKQSIVEEFEIEIDERHTEIDDRIKEELRYGSISSDAKKELLKELKDIEKLIAKYRNYLDNDENLNYIQIKERQELYIKTVEELPKKEYVEILNRIKSIEKDKNILEIQQIKVDINSIFTQNKIERNEKIELEKELESALYVLVKNDQLKLLEKIDKYTLIGATDIQKNDLRLELESIDVFLEEYIKIADFINPNRKELENRQKEISKKIEEIGSIDDVISNITKEIDNLGKTPLDEIEHKVNNIKSSLSSSLMPDDKEKELGKLLKEKLYIETVKHQEKLKIEIDNIEEVDGKKEVIQQVYDEFLSRKNILSSIIKRYESLGYEIEDYSDKLMEIKNNQKAIEDGIASLVIEQHKNYKKIDESIENLYAEIYLDGSVDLEKTEELNIEDVYSIEKSILSEEAIVKSEKETLLGKLISRLKIVIEDVQNKMDSEIKTVKKSEPISIEEYRNLNGKLEVIDELVKEQKRLGSSYNLLSNSGNSKLYKKQTQLYSLLNEIALDQNEVNLEKDELEETINNLESPIKDFELDLIISAIDKLDKEDRLDLANKLLDKLYEDIDSRQLEIQDDVELLEKPTNILQKQKLLDRTYELQSHIDRHKRLEVKYDVKYSNNILLQTRQDILLDIVLGIKVLTEKPGKTFIEYKNEIDSALNEEELKEIQDSISKDLGLTVQEKDLLSDYIINKISKLNSNDGKSEYEKFVDEINKAKEINALSTIKIRIELTSESKLPQSSKKSLYKLIDEKRVEIYIEMIGTIDSFDKFKDIRDKISEDKDLDYEAKYLLSEKLEIKLSKLRTDLLEEYELKIDEAGNKNELQNIRKDVNGDVNLLESVKEYLISKIDSKIIDMNNKLAKEEEIQNTIEDMPDDLEDITEIDDVISSIEDSNLEEDVKQSLGKKLRDKLSEIIIKKQGNLEKEIENKNGNATEIEKANFKESLNAIDPIIEKHKEVEEKYGIGENSNKDFKVRQRELSGKIDSLEEIYNEEQLNDINNSIDNISDEPNEEEIGNIQESIDSSELPEEIKNILGNKLRDELGDRISSIQSKLKEDVELKDGKSTEEEKKLFESRLEKSLPLISKHKELETIYGKGEILNKELELNRQEIEILIEKLIDPSKEEIEEIEDNINKLPEKPSIEEIDEIEDDIEGNGNLSDEVKDELKIKLRDSLALKTRNQQDKIKEEIEDKNEIATLEEKEDLRTKAEEISALIEKHKSLEEELEDKYGVGNPSNEVLKLSQKLILVSIRDLKAPNEEEIEEIEDNINKLPEKPSIEEIDEIKDDIEGNGNLSDEVKDELKIKLRDSLALKIRNQQDKIKKEIEDKNEIATTEEKEVLKTKSEEISALIEKHKSLEEELEDKYGVGNPSNEVLKLYQKLILVSIRGLKEPNEGLINDIKDKIDRLPDNPTLLDVERIENSIEQADISKEEKEDLGKELLDKFAGKIEVKQEDLLSEVKSKDDEVTSEEKIKLKNKLSDINILVEKHEELEIKYGEGRIRNKELKQSQTIIALLIEGLKEPGDTEEPGNQDNKEEIEAIESIIEGLPENPSENDINEIENIIDLSDLSEQVKKDLGKKLANELAYIIESKQEKLLDDIAKLTEVTKEEKSELNLILSEIDKLVDKHRSLERKYGRADVANIDLKKTQITISREISSLKDKKSDEEIIQDEINSLSKEVEVIDIERIEDLITDSSLLKETKDKLMKSLEGKLKEIIALRQKDLEKIIKDANQNIDKITEKDLEKIDRELDKIGQLLDKYNVMSANKDEHNLVAKIYSGFESLTSKDLNENQDTLEEDSKELKANFAVNKAETSRKISDVDSARELVKNLKNEKLKEDLNSRLNEVEKEIKVIELVEKLKASETKEQKDLDDAREAVKGLKNEKLKEELNKILEEIQREIDELEKPVDPEEPGIDPEEPGTDPEEPGTDPEEPGTDPEEPGTDPEEPGTEPEEPGTDPEEPGDPEKPSKDDVEDNINKLPENPSIDEIKDIEDNIDGNDNLTDKDKEILGGKLRDKIGKEIRDKQDSMLEEIEECDGVATEEKKEELKLELANISEMISKHRELEEKYGVGYIQNDILGISQKIINLSIEGLKLPETEKPEEPGEDEEQSNEKEVEKVEEMINSIGSNLSEETIDSIKEVISNNEEILEKDKIKLYGQLRDKLGEEIRLKQKDLLNEVKSYKGIANENQQEELMRKLESISTLILKHKELEEEYGLGYIINDVLELSKEMISMYIEGLTPEKEDPGTDPEKPGDGGSTEKPGDGGSTEKPGDGGSTEKPGDGGSTEKPGDGGSTEKPGDGGSTEKPGDGGSTEKPGNGGSTEKPGDGGSTEKPGNDGSTEKPGNDGSTEKPGNDGSTEKPGNGGSTEKPGNGGSTEKPGDGGSSVNIGNIIDSNKKISKAYLKGYSDGTIRPEAKITREEVATMVYRVFDFVGVGYHEFRDVENGRWSEEYIAKLYSEGIIEGYNGEFRPTDSMTRGEFATLMARALGLKEIKFNKFKDIKGHWAEGYINAVAKAGYIKGYGNGNFRPDDSITRAEVVIILNRVLDISVDIASLEEDANIYKDLSKDKWYYADMLVASIDHEYKLVNGKHVWIKK